MARPLEGFRILDMSRVLSGPAATMLLLVQFGTLPDGTFDLFCAPVVGALVGLLIELILWVETQRTSAKW